MSGLRAASTYSIISGGSWMVASGGLEGSVVFGVIVSEALGGRVVCVERVERERVRFLLCGEKRREFG
jgi:hypothetical protein